MTKTFFLTNKTFSMLSEQLEYLVSMSSCSDQSRVNKAKFKGVFFSLK